jgi:hypothetical protein
MPTTNTSFGPKTGALDVASAFAGEIRGKIGEFFVRGGGGGFLIFEYSLFG